MCDCEAVGECSPGHCFDSSAISSVSGSSRANASLYERFYERRWYGGRFFRDQHKTERTTYLSLLKR